MDNSFDQQANKIEAFHKSEAKGFAEKETVIANLIGQCPPGNHRGGVDNYRGEFLEVFFGPTVVSIPNTNFYFAEWNDDIDLIRQTKDLGVNTNYILTRETVTEEEANDLERPISEIHYFFDKQGNYAAYNHQSKWVSGEKEETITPKEMTEGDFRDVGIALTNMQRELELIIAENQ